MKYIYTLGIVFTLFGCNNENAWDCIQASGEIIQQDYHVDEFKKIIIWNRVQLIISQGEEQSVVVETGENLLNEILVRVEDSILKVSNINSCNYVRDYGITKVYVTAPDIYEIRNSSGLTVESIGTIGFEELTLFSEDRFVEDEFHIDGDFRLNLDVKTLTIDANGISKFYLNGKARVGHFGLFDGDVRVEAAGLEIEILHFFHRSTNKMIVYPTHSISGKIVSSGDVIAKNHPPIVEVEELFTGRLIFE